MLGVSLCIKVVLFERISFLNLLWEILKRKNKNKKWKEVPVISSTFIFCDICCSFSWRTLIRCLNEWYQIILIMISFFIVSFTNKIIQIIIRITQERVSALDICAHLFLLLMVEKLFSILVWVWSRILKMTIWWS